MTRTWIRALFAPVVVAAAALSAAGIGQDGQAQRVHVPDPGVPEVTTLESLFVRAAYNAEGYAVVGYRAANSSVGDTWMLLDVGMALRNGQKAQKITRDAVSLSTPDGKKVPLPSNREYVSANPTAIEYRAYMSRDPLTFPGETGMNVNCPGPGGTFFHDFGDASSASVDPPLDGVALNPRCKWSGRLYFPVPGGIRYGQYFLDIKFDKTLIRVPFRIMTKDEQEVLRANYGSIKTQIEKASKPIKK
ncbi:MAG: hypothetical protein EHM91_01705 [Planctomycetota bacterium]|nr:MAG: hypothetical protein EHM91_01705 [Planctomycetota bacterium]